MAQVIQTFDAVENFRYKFKPSDGNQIIKVFENNPQNIIRKMGLVSEHTTVSSFIKDFTCYTELNSLPEVGFISFDLEDSETAKAVKALEHTWNKASMHLKLWDNINNKGWEPLCIVPLQQPEIYAYKKYDLLDELTRNLACEAGDYWSIGVSIEDAGWGGVKANDTVIIRGNATRQVVINNPISDLSKDVILNTPNSVTDENIGQRFPDDTFFLGNNPGGTLTGILSSLAHQVKLITGLTNWKGVPPTTLEKLKHLEAITLADIAEIDSINALRMTYESLEDDFALLDVNTLKLTDLNTTFNTQWQNITLSSPWINADDFGVGIPQWRLLRDGNVQIRGAVRSTIPVSSESIIAVLPIAARPENLVYIQAYAGGETQVYVNTLGELRFQTGGAQIGMFIDRIYPVD